MIAIFKNMEKQLAAAHLFQACLDLHVALVLKQTKHFV